MRQAQVVFLGVAFLFSIGARADRPLPFYDAKSLTPYWNFEKSSENRAFSPAVLDSLSLTDENGKPFTQKAFDGKVSLVNFFFRGCGSLCPMMMHKLQSLQSELRRRGADRDLEFFSFSVMPEQDSPAVLKKYAASHGMDLARWSLLTGDRKEIYRIGREIFQADRSPRGVRGDFIHSSNVYLLDSERRIRGIYDTQNTEQMGFLEQDIVRLERENAPVRK